MKQFYIKMPALRRATLLLCIFVFAQCSTTKLSLQDGQQIEELGVCLSFADDVPPEFQEQFNNSLSQYIANYNTQRHAFKLTSCQDARSLTIQVDNVQYTTSGQRATGVFVSTLGIFGVPVAMASAGLPFYIFFYYFPTNQTHALLSLSPDIAHPNLGNMTRQYTTGGMFGSDERQRLRHSRRFDQHLHMIFTELEQSYKRTAKRPIVKLIQTETANSAF